MVSTPLFENFSDENLLAHQSQVVKVYLYSGVAFPGVAAARRQTVTDCIYPQVNSLLNIKEGGGFLSRIHFSCTANLPKQMFLKNGYRRLILFAS